MCRRADVSTCRRADVPTCRRWECNCVRVFRCSCVQVFMKMQPNKIYIFSCTLAHTNSPSGEPHLHTCISSANPEYSGLRCAASAIDQFSIHRLIIITPLSIIILLSGSNSLSARIILLSRYPLQLLAALWLAAGFPLLSGLGEKVALRLAF